MEPIVELETTEKDETTHSQPLEDGLSEEQKAKLDAIEQTKLEQRLSRYGIGTFPKESQSSQSQTEATSAEMTSASQEVTSPTPEVTSSIPKDVYVVMVGYTGSGLSSTGNRILQRSDAFPTSSDSSSCTKEVKKEDCQYEDIKIHVVDTPGFSNTHKAKWDRAALYKKVPEVHCILAVCNLSSHRHQEEALQLSKCIKKVFCDAALCNTCLLFTHADIGLAEKSLEELIKEEMKGNMENLLKEAKGGKMAVNNMADAQKELQLSREGLIKMLLDIASQKPSLQKDGKPKKVAKASKPAKPEKQKKAEKPSKSESASKPNKSSTKEKAEQKPDTHVKSDETPKPEAVEKSSHDQTDGAPPNATAKASKQEKSTKTAKNDKKFGKKNTTEEVAVEISGAIQQIGYKKLDA